MFVVSVYQRAVGEAMMWPSFTHFGDGGRYAIVPALLLVSVALALIDSAAGRQRSPRSPNWGRWIAAGAAIVLLAGIATSFDVRNTAARGTPSWDDGLDGAAAACVAEHLPAAAIATSPPGFGVTVPCNRL